jgi:hypothetical protein
MREIVPNIFQIYMVYHCDKLRELSSKFQTETATLCDFSKSLSFIQGHKRWSRI